VLLKHTFAGRFLPSGTLFNAGCRHRARTVPEQEPQGYTSDPIGATDHNYCAWRARFAEREKRRSYRERNLLADMVEKRLHGGPLVFDLA
jgi:hypothetical protein